VQFLFPEGRICKVATKLNLTQALNLSKQIEKSYNFSIQLLSNGKDGYLFCIPQNLVDNSVYLSLEQFASENKLSLFFGLGYCILFEP